MLFGVQTLRINCQETVLSCRLVHILQRRVSLWLQVATSSEP